MVETSKDKVLKVALRLFSEKGYEATSIRDLAREAKVNVSSVNYHFGSKQGLFEYLVEDFTKKKFSLVVSILEPPETLSDFKLRLSMFIKQFFLLNINDQNSFLMINKNLDLFVKMSPEVFERTFLRIHLQFLNFVKISQKKKILRDEFPHEIVTQILFGGLIDVIRGQKVRKHFGVSIAEDASTFNTYAETFIDIFLNGMGGTTSDS